MLNIQNKLNDLFGKNSVTRRCRKYSWIDSEYGNIKFNEWCDREAKRINSVGGKVKVMEYEGFCWVQ